MSELLGDPSSMSGPNDRPLPRLPAIVRELQQACYRQWEKVVTGLTMGQRLESIRLAIAVAAAKGATAVVRGLRLGAASVMPGSIAARLQPQVLPLLWNQVREGVILVAGTNGKTTTALLLQSMLVAAGYRTTHNASGANLLNGLATALLADANAFGKLDVDFAILEVDENVVPLVLETCQPRAILGLNLFRDQLDRYGEVDTIARRWQTAIAPLEEDVLVALNGDDPTLADMGQKLAQTVKFFGLSEPDLYLEEIPHAVDAIYCPRCGEGLNYAGVYLSHLGDYRCDNCGFAKPDLDIASTAWPQILIGVYNKYNTLAASLVAGDLGIPETAIRSAIAEFRAAFGRAEDLDIDGTPVRILLSKNPVGTNETIRAVLERQAKGESSTTLIVLNDRIPDGTDVSWIWDVDTEKLFASGQRFIVSGDRAYDMALRLQYSCDDPTDLPEEKLIVEPDLKTAIARALALTPAGETLHVLPTYSAMLEVRQVLVGRGIL